MNTSPGSSFERLVEIMRRLRAPDGCPWDREQTPASLRPFVLEETYEVLEAIEHGTAQDLCEELGDFVFEAVFLARMHERPGTSRSATSWMGLPTSWCAGIRTCSSAAMARTRSRAARSSSGGKR
jgi:NTP pyrophosphatase (non-canonical NTP hydrolase)